MANYDNKITGHTVGDDLDITRTVGGVPDSQAVIDAYLTVMPNGASDTETVFLFQKHITTTNVPAQGVIDTAVTYTVTADGVQNAGSIALTVDPLPTTIPEGVVLQFSGGAWATVSERALQGSVTVKVDQLDAPIADAETASYNTVRLKFNLQGTQTALLAPNKAHDYDIQINTDASKRYTIEDGTITFRPQRTIGI
jgi:hypothetical protein